MAIRFDPTEEQTMIRDALQRFAAERYDVEKRRIYRQSATGFGEGNWAALAELGLFALPLPEAAGGMGGHGGDVMALMVEIGRGLIVEPVLASICLCADIVARCGSDEQRTCWLDELIAGTSRWTFVLNENGLDPGDGARLSRRGEDWSLEAQRGFAPDAGGVDAFLFLASVEDGLVLVSVPAEADGLDRRDHRILDGSIAAAVSVHDAIVKTADVIPISATELVEILDRGRFAVACETLGVMERLLADTLDYVRTRQQFGSPIGGFQTIQHRMARLYLAVEQSRSLLFKAALAKPEARSAAIDAAKAFVSDAALHLAHECVQFHGGMGITDELAIGYGHKRIVVLSRLFGNAQADRARYLAAA